ncbi:MAG: diguanylate cyclase [Gammaproteobacteria bacterium]|nr:diguanylate cyclase [Gammaproteobacteria bacterium]
MSDPSATSSRWPKRYSVLFTLLGLLILVEVMTVFAVLASQRFATERALREYSHELLKNVVDETRENAVAYLRQAQDSVALASRVFEADLLDISDPGRLERFFLEQLRVIPQIDSLYYGDLSGNFVFSKRDPDAADDGFLTKIIRNDASADERVTLIYRDRHLTETARRLTPDDPFDPRDRPWYTRALNRHGEVWTQPYIFYTSQRPGLTVASAVWKPRDSNIGVVGADIELSAISEFLKTQRIGTSGAAFIVDRNGDVLAHPLDARLSAQEGDATLRLKKLSELDPITTQAGIHLERNFPDLLALDYSHYDKFALGEKSYLSMFVPLLKQDQNHWIMGVYAPEDELAQKIREGQRESIFLGVAMSLLVVTAAVLIGLIMLRPIHNLQRQASEDPLTGLLNRRSFDEIAAKQLMSAGRQQRPLSAIMVDIDHFKAINDAHGHGVGDEVLQAVARRIRRGLSAQDVLSRYGGEEFAVLLPDTSLTAGQLVAERLRHAVAESPIKTSAGEMNVTISLGVAERDGWTNGVTHLLERADHGLLAAKRDGRNRVVSAVGAAA